MRKLSFAAAAAVAALALPAPALVNAGTSSSPVGLWQAVNGVLYQWVAISGGYEEHSMTPHKLDMGCLVKKGDAVYRYTRLKSGLYRVTHRYWRAGSGGAGASGTNCTSYWHAPEETRKLVVAGDFMTLSCGGKPNEICFSYSRVLKNAPATASPLGLWKAKSGQIYLWVAIPGGYEERSMTAHKLKRSGCLVKAGVAVDRYWHHSGTYFRVAYNYWDPKKGGAGASGTNCTSAFDPPEAIVRIVVAGNRLTMFCDDHPTQVCWTYTRVARRTAAAR